MTTALLYLLALALWLFTLLLTAIGFYSAGFKNGRSGAFVEQDEA